MNIQFVITKSQGGDDPAETAFVLEVNPRASRTVPYLSKVTGVPMVDLATRCMMGEKLKDLGYASGLWTLLNRESRIADRGSESTDHRARIIPEQAFIDRTAQIPEPILYAVKAPVFSFQKLSRVEPSLGPEMKSTGEILGIDNTYEGALYKALVASGITFKGDGLVLITVRNEDKPKAVEIARELHKSGKKLAATKGTCEAFTRAGIPCQEVQRISQGSPHILDLILSGQVSLMINTPSQDKVTELEAARIRRGCIETGIPCVTSIDTAGAIIRALDVFADPSKASCLRLEEYFTPA